MPFVRRHSIFVRRCVGRLSHTQTHLFELEHDWHMQFRAVFFPSSSRTGKYWPAVTQLPTADPTADSNMWEAFSGAIGTRKYHFKNTHKRTHTRGSAVNQLRCITKETTERWTNLATDSIEITFGETHENRCLKRKIAFNNAKLSSLSCRSFWTFRCSRLGTS